MKLLLAGLMLTGAVFAQTINTVTVLEKRNFRINERTTFGGSIFYACDSVEDAAEELLSKLGASDVKAKCHGGIRPWGGWSGPAYLNLSFNVKRVSDDGSEEGAYEAINFRSHGNCHLYSEIFKGVKGRLKSSDRTIALALEQTATLGLTAKCLSSFPINKASDLLAFFYLFED